MFPFPDNNLSLADSSSIALFVLGLHNYDTLLLLNISFKISWLLIYMNRVYIKMLILCRAAALYIRYARLHRAQQKGWQKIYIFYYPLETLLYVVLLKSLWSVQVFFFF